MPLEKVPGGGDGDHNAVKLLARVESLLRRREQLAGRDPIEHLVLRFGTVEMDRPARKVLRDGIPVSLRSKSTTCCSSLSSGVGRSCRGAI